MAKFRTAIDLGHKVHFQEGDDLEETLRILRVKVSGTEMHDIDKFVESVHITEQPKSSYTRMSIAGETKAKMLSGIKANI